MEGVLDGGRASTSNEITLLRDQHINMKSPLRTVARLLTRRLPLCEALGAHGFFNPSCPSRASAMLSHGHAAAQRRQDWNCIHPPNFRIGRRGDAQSKQAQAHATRLSAVGCSVASHELTLSVDSASCQQIHVIHMNIKTSILNDLHYCRYENHPASLVECVLICYHDLLTILDSFLLSVGTTKKNPLL